MYNFFQKSLNPRNIEKSVSDILIRNRFPFEFVFWISGSGCKLTVLPDIQSENRIVIISGPTRILKFPDPVSSKISDLQNFLRHTMCASEVAGVTFPDSDSAHFLVIS